MPLTCFSNEATCHRKHKFPNRQSFIMKTLYLVRHAKSSWKFPELEDFDRPLNGRGKRDAPMMGQRLRQAGVCPQLILSSPAQRTRKTARALAKAMGYSSDIRHDDALYDASSEQLLAAVQTVDDTVTTLLLVGHNPELTELVNQLTSHSIDNVVTAGVVSITFSVDHWSEVALGAGQFEKYDYPKRLPEE